MVLIHSAKSDFRHPYLQNDTIGASLFNVLLLFFAEQVEVASKWSEWNFEGWTLTKTENGTLKGCYLFGE